jgi:ABC-type phosphate transport system substrate-binding protein
MSRRLAISVALLLALTAFCATGLGHPASGSPAPAFQVIVNPRSSVTSVDRKFLEEAFLKKVTAWPDDQVIRPVDLAPDSGVRRAFTHDILNRSVEAVKSYWQQRIFSGRDVPPPELARDEDVVQFVLKHEGGVGYVSGTADVEGCRVIGVR